MVDLNQGHLRVFREPEGDRYQINTVWTQNTIALIAFPQLELKLSRIMVN